MGHLAKVRACAFALLIGIACGCAGPWISVSAVRTPPTGFRNAGGWASHSWSDAPSFNVSVFFSDSTAWLRASIVEKFRPPDRVRLALLDSVSVVRPAGFLWLLDGSAGECLWLGRQDDSLFCLFPGPAHPDSGATAGRAWHVDPSSGRLVELPATEVRCAGGYIRPFNLGRREAQIESPRLIRR